MKNKIDFKQLVDFACRCTANGSKTWKELAKIWNEEVNNPRSTGGFNVTADRLFEVWRDESITLETSKHFYVIDPEGKIQSSGEEVSRFNFSEFFVVYLQSEKDRNDKIQDLEERISNLENQDLKSRIRTIENKLDMAPNSY